MAGVTFDSGALIDHERGGDRIQIWLKAATIQGTVPTVPSVAVAETWRGPRSARIAQLLKICAIEPVDEDLARRAGEAIATVGSSATVDAIVAATAARRGDVLVTGDPEDMQPFRKHFPNLRIEAL